MFGKMSALCLHFAKSLVAASVDRRYRSKKMILSSNVWGIPKASGEEYQPRFSRVHCPYTRDTLPLSLLRWPRQQSRRLEGADAAIGAHRTTNQLLGSDGQPLGSRHQGLESA